MENEPATSEGRAAVALVAKPGAWLRAGWTGRIVGVDLRAGLARIETAGLDIDLTCLLAGHGEEGLLAGVAEATPTDKD